MNTEDRDKILESLFTSGNAVQEYLTFERNFERKAHPVVQAAIAQHRNRLDSQYMRALTLLAEIKLRCKGLLGRDQEHNSGWARLKGKGELALETAWLVRC
jgi:hypothetical protein